VKLLNVFDSPVGVLSYKQMLCQANATGKSRGVPRGNAH
jgi:hypothetical protein